MIKGNARNEIATATHWTEAFGSSPAETILSPELLEQIPEGWRSPPSITGTIRIAIKLAVGGGAVRFRFSNEVGRSPLKIEAASVARAGEGPGLTRGPSLPLTFDGRDGVTIEAGAPIVSDAVDLSVDRFETIVISVHIAHDVVNSVGIGAMVFAPGNQIHQSALEDQTVFLGRPIVSSIQVETRNPVSVIVALGDSITDGLRYEFETTHGWPERLAVRLATAPDRQRYAVVNAGIGGNRVLASGWGLSALARLDRDVLRIEGISHLILFEGINDIGMGGQTLFGDSPEVTAEHLIAGYRQIIRRANSRGAKVIGATLPPFEGAPYHSARKAQTRDAVNEWIRTSGAFAAVVDFDKVLRDPHNPQKLREEFDVGDHLHPNETALQAMGDAFDLTFFD